MTNGKTEHMIATDLRMRETLKNRPDYMRGFYNSMVQSGKTSSYMTRQNYTYSVLKFVDTVNKPITEISYDDIVNYLTELSINKDGSTKSGSYMIAVYGALKRFFKYLINSDRIVKNPMEKVERPAPKPADQVVRVSLTKKEFSDCVTKIKKRTDNYALRDELMFALFITTAMRCTALSEINVSDIDFNTKTLKIIDKGNHYREFSLSDDIMDLINKWLEKRAVLLIGAHATDALFISSRKKRICQNEIRNITSRQCELTGKHITPHKFRRSCATWIVSNGGTVFQAQQMLGHQSPKTTSEIYLQNKTEEFKKAATIASKFYEA